VTHKLPDAVPISSDAAGLARSMLAGLIAGVLAGSIAAFAPISELAAAARSLVERLP
jgi:hypothetical protein